MTSRKLGSNAYHLAWFGVLSVLSGLLVAGLALPAAFLTGTVVKAGADSLESLPADLTIGQQSERSKVLMADGSTLAEFYAENRVYVPLNKIAPIMQTAQLAIEDYRFYEHGAIDFKGTARAAVRSASGTTQGGSTLTQQYVKQVQIEAATVANDPAARERAQEQTLTRKVRELRYAVAVEKKLTKKQILERYMNIAFYGANAYGVEAASRRYFNTSASQLTLGQAAMLAGLVQNPAATDPINNPQGAINRRNIVLNRMVELKKITPAEAAKAKKEGFDKSKVQPTPQDCISSPFQTLCLYVKNTLLSEDFKVLGKSRTDRLSTLQRGGLTIKTLIDPKAQASAEKAVNRLIAPTDPFISTAVLIQPKSGLIVAMAQNRTKIGDGPGQTWYNYSVDAEHGGAEGYQAGSTFKTFTMAAALQKGITPSRRYDAQPKMNFKGQTFQACNGPFVQGDFPVKNSTPGQGSMDMYRAAKQSTNTYFVPLSRDVGLCNVVKMTQAAGVKRADGKDMIKDNAPGANGGYDNIPSFTLGPVEVTPLSMAEGYATFANRGVHCNPNIIASVTTKAGKNVEVPGGDCQKVMEPQIADGVNKILQQVIESGTARPAHLNDSRDQAAKTGTTNSAEAVWLAGYTPDMAGVAMIAADKQAPVYKGKSRRSLTGKYAHGTDYPNGYYINGSGGGDAGRIWRTAMSAALENVDTPGKFVEPGASVIEGKRVALPNIEGMSRRDAMAAVEAVGFGTEMVYQYSSRPKGTYLYAYPSSGTHPLSRNVQFVISKGPKPKSTPAKPNSPSPSKKSSRTSQEATLRETRKRAAVQAAQRKAAQQKAAQARAAQLAAQQAAQRAAQTKTAQAAAQRAAQARAAQAAAARAAQARAAQAAAQRAAAARAAQAKAAQASAQRAAAARAAAQRAAAAKAAQAKAKQPVAKKTP
ncbi:transglycosylase domain-containing protein [Luteococcus sp. H138]|uniref:transglycosylase domain-containing protein n=1 Tax=unclassified Luteococcus TaxID=2639923 RepID=UPI00313B8772